MSVLMKSCTASLLLAVSFAACAAGEPATDTPSATPSAAPEAQVAVRDAATGQLRAPTASEMKALLAAGPITAKAKGLGTRARRTASGATGVRLSDQFLSYSVMVKQPDGRLVEYCFESPEAAQSATATASPAPASRALPTE
jgi:hypothetical protein